MNAVSSEKRRYELKARAEAKQRTRERIAAAAAELHQEVGVAKTTVADIARRAGVQRLTVYNHFPDLAELLPACSAHYLSEHPLPDITDALAADDPRERLRATLAAFYGWYRENERLQLSVQGERASVPELDAWMAQSSDAMLRQLGDGLAAGFTLRGGRAKRARALVALALDFWTWRRLSLEGLEDDEAAELMAASLDAVASARR